MERTRQSSRKRHKVSNGEQKNMPSIDRLSALPDDVVCRILSFLPTKLSVSTSILSKRWRCLWAHVPNLDFDDSEIHYDSEFSVLDIINRVMSLYKVETLNTFRLLYDDDDEDDDDFQLETCITSAIGRNVKNLYLSLVNPAILPRCIFTCKTLVDLRCYEIRMTGIVCLPSLKRLHLDRVKYESDETLPHLLSGCPVIEALIVDRIAARGEHMVVCCYIYSPTLNRLMLNSNFQKDDDRTYRVKLNTPALRYLKLQGSIFENVSAGSLTSLIEADIYFDNNAHVLYPRSTLEFVGSLCTVKCLILSTGCLKVPDSTFSALAMKFHNLTELNLAADGRFLSCYLGNADNLEVLIIREVNIDLKYWMEPHRVPTCLSSHLRTVRIDDFECTEQGFNMVRYLLRNGKVLDMMEIYSRDKGTDLKTKFDALKRISLFERGSEACKLVFH